MQHCADWAACSFELERDLPEGHRNLELRAEWRELGAGSTSREGGDIGRERSGGLSAGGMSRERGGGLSAGSTSTERGGLSVGSMSRERGSGLSAGSINREWAAA
jgi:hypothetical protein